MQIPDDEAAAGEGGNPEPRVWELDRLPKSLLDFSTPASSKPGDKEILKEATTGFINDALPVVKTYYEENMYGTKISPEIVQGAWQEAGKIRGMCERMGLLNMAEAFAGFDPEDFNENSLCEFMLLSVLTRALSDLPDLNFEFENAKILVELHNLVQDEARCWENPYGEGEGYGFGFVRSYSRMAELLGYSELAAEIKENMPPPVGNNGFMAFWRILESTVHSQTIDTLSKRSHGSFQIKEGERRSLRIEKTERGTDNIVVEFSQDFRRATISGEGLRTQQFTLTIYENGDVARTLGLLFNQWVKNPEAKIQWADVFRKLPKRKKRPAIADWVERSPMEFFRPTWRDRKENQEFFRKILECGQDENEQHSVSYWIKLKSKGVEYRVATSDITGSNAGTRCARRRRRRRKQ